MRPGMSGNQAHMSEPVTAKQCCGQHTFMSGRDRWCLHPCPHLSCCSSPGKSSARTRSSAKLSKLNARKKKCSRRRPTFLTSPGCESKGRNRYACMSMHQPLHCVIMPLMNIYKKVFAIRNQLSSLSKLLPMVQQAVATLCALACFLICQLCMIYRCLKQGFQGYHAADLNDPF